MKISIIVLSLFFLSNSIAMAAKANSLPVADSQVIQTGKNIVVGSMVATGAELSCEKIEANIKSDLTETTTETSKVRSDATNLAGPQLDLQVATVKKSYHDKLIGKGMCNCAKDKYAWIYT